MSLILKTLHNYHEAHQSPVAETASLISLRKLFSSTVHALSPADTWVDKYGNYLYSYAFYRVFDNTVAEDLVQDTYTAALAARSGFKGKSTEEICKDIDISTSNYWVLMYRARLQIRLCIETEWFSPVTVGNDQ